MIMFHNNSRMACIILQLEAFSFVKTDPSHCGYFGRQCCNTILFELLNGKRAIILLFVGKVQS